MTAMSGGTVSMPVKPDAKGFGAKLAESIRGETGGLGALGAELGKKLVAGLAVVGIAASVGEFVKKGIEEYSAADALNAQFAAGIKSTGNAANLSVKGMDELAASIAGYSGQAYDSIGKTEQVLQTFTNIKNVGPNKIFDDATTAAANMAAKLGGDASASAIQLGKALNDPIKGVTALQRVGVSFTDGQKAQIKAMVASGNTMGAQKVILGELSKEFGGAAKAAGQTLPGEINRSKVAFGELAKAVVSGVMPIVAPAIGGIANLMNKATPAIEHFSEGISEKLGEAVKIVGDALKLIKGSFTGLGADVDLGKLTNPLIDFGALLRRVFDGAKPVISGLISSIRPIAATIIAAFAPVAPVVAKLIPQLLGLWLNLSPVGLAFKALAPVLPVIGKLLGSLAATLSSALGQALTIIVPLIGHLVTALSGVFVAIMPTVIHLVALAASTFNTLVPVVLSVVSAVLPLVVALVGQLAPILVRLVDTVLPPVVLIFKALVPAITPLIQILVAVLIPVIKALLPVVTTVFGAIVPVIKAALQIVQGVIQVVLGVLTGNWKEAWTGIKNVVGGVWNLIVSVVRGALAIVGSVLRAALSVLGAVWSAAWKGISAVASGVWNGIVGFVRSYINAVRTVISTVVGWITTYWRAETTLWRTVITAVWNAIRSTVTGAINGVRTVISTVVGWITAYWRAETTLWRTVITAVWNAIRSTVTGAINGVRSVISSILSTIRGLWSAGWNAISSFVSRAWGRIVSGVTGGIRRVVGAARGIGSRVLSAIGNLGSLLFNSGASVIQGFINGIKSTVGAIGGAVGGVMDFVKGFFPHSPAKHGPFSGAGWTGLLNSGAAIVDQFSAGVVGNSSSFATAFQAAVGTPKVGVTAVGVTSSATPVSVLAAPRASLLAAPQRKPVAVTSLAGTAAAGAGVPSLQQNFYGPMGYTKEEVADKISTKSRRALQRANISRVALT